MYGFVVVDKVVVLQVGGGLAVQPVGHLQHYDVGVVGHCVATVEREKVLLACEHAHRLSVLVAVVACLVGKVNGLGKLTFQTI